MELYEAMRTTFACRDFTDDPLPDEVIYEMIENARFRRAGVIDRATGSSSCATWRPGSGSPT